MENFFAVLESELFHPTQFADTQCLQSEITAYIHYYNNDRIKLKLKELSEPHWICRRVGLVSSTLPF